MMDMWTADIKWKCSDGRVLGVKDMTDRHLTNAVRFIKRKSIEKTRKANSSYATIHNVDRGAVWEMFVPPIFGLMLIELKERGLKYDPYNDIYEKVRAYKIRRMKSSEVRDAMKEYASMLTKTREIDLDN